VIFIPYIDRLKRGQYECYIRMLIKILCEEEKDYEGHFNYIISTINNGLLKHYGVKYKNVNKLIGVLECAKLELYSRIAVPYEKKKASENGDVFDL